MGSFIKIGILYIHNQLLIRNNFMGQVKDLPPYIAVSSNTSGSTPKDLFEDMAEELEKQVNPFCQNCLRGFFFFLF